MLTGVLPLQIQSNETPVKGNKNNSVNQNETETFLNMFQTLVEQNSVETENSEFTTKVAQLEGLAQATVLTSDELLESIHSILLLLSNDVIEENEQLYGNIIDLMSKFESLDTESFVEKQDIVQSFVALFTQMNFTTFSNERVEQSNVLNENSKLNMNQFIKMIQSIFQSIRMNNDIKPEERTIVDKIIRHLDTVFPNENVMKRAYANIEKSNSSRFQQVNHYPNVYIPIKNSSENIIFTSVQQSLNEIEVENILAQRNENITGISSVTTLQIQSSHVKVDALTLLDGQGRPVNYESFVKQFASILNKGKFLDNGQLQKLTIQLKPAHLGTLKIELLQQNNEMIARIISSSNSAKELIESQIQGLRHAFVQQNINVSRIDISAQLYQDEQQSFTEHEQAKDSNQHEQNNDKQEKENFADTLLETLVNYEV